MKFADRISNEKLSPEEKKIMIRETAILIHNYLVLLRRRIATITELFYEVTEEVTIAEPFNFMCELLDALQKEVHNRKVLRMHCLYEDCCVGTPEHIPYRFTLASDYSHLHFPRNTKQLVLDALEKIYGNRCFSVSLAGFYKDHRAYKVEESKYRYFGGKIMVLVDQNGITKIINEEEIWDVMRKLE